MLYTDSRGHHIITLLVLNLSIQYICRNEMVFPIYYSTSTRTTLRVFHLADIALVRCGIYSYVCTQSSYNCDWIKYTLATYTYLRCGINNHFLIIRQAIHRMLNTYRNKSSWRLVLRIFLCGDDVRFIYLVNVLMLIVKLQFNVPERYYFGVYILCFSADEWFHSNFCVTVIAIVSINLICDSDSV